jgi:phage protein
MGHEMRKHALLSASSAHRWLNCPPSARLEEGLPSIVSDAAREGTLAHELAELKVSLYSRPLDLSKKAYTAAVKKLKEDELWDGEMEGYTDEYVEYIKKTATAFDSVPYIDVEKRLDLTQWIPDGFGTADCILIGGGVLHVIDFKYGKNPNGRVEADHNPQLMCYGLGAYQALSLIYKIETIRMTIVQPRLSDGISEWACTVEELLEFGEKVKKIADLAIKGEGEFNPSEKTCRYCKIRDRCKARAEKNALLVLETSKDSKTLTNVEIAKYLKQGADVSAWLSDLQATALAECLAGREVPGWKAVEGRSTRDWSNMDKAFEVLTKSGIDEAMLWERRPLSLAQVEKVVGKKEFAELVGDFVVRKPGTPTIVEESDRRKPIDTISAKDVFK